MYFFFFYDAEVPIIGQTACFQIKYRNYHHKLNGSKKQGGFPFNQALILLNLFSVGPVSIITIINPQTLDEYKGSGFAQGPLGHVCGSEEKYA